MSQMRINQSPSSEPEHDGVYLSIVVPIWNGAERLSAVLPELAEWMGRKSFRIELILANDGSDAVTSRLLERFAADHHGVILMDEMPHQGKGSAVVAGMLTARGKFRVFVDSDLAYPATEIDKILQVLESGSDVAVACRVLPDSRYVMSPAFIHYLYTRHLLSRSFNRAIRALLLPGLLDTQAGLKGFTADAAATIFNRVTISGFGFDLECLYIARVHALSISQVPVLFRYDDEPSTVRLVKDAFLMAGNIVTIRLRGPRYYRAPVARVPRPAAGSEVTESDLEVAS